MIVFPEVLRLPAEQAGIQCPDDLENYDPDEFPYWHVYSLVQLGAPLPSWSSHYENAKVVVSVPKERIAEVTFKDLEEMGLEVGYPIP